MLVRGMILGFFLLWFIPPRCMPKISIEHLKEWLYERGDDVECLVAVWTNHPFSHDGTKLHFHRFPSWLLPLGLSPHHLAEPLRSSSVPLPPSPPTGGRVQDGGQVRRRLLRPARVLRNARCAPRPRAADCGLHGLPRVHNLLLRHCDRCFRHPRLCEPEGGASQGLWARFNMQPVLLYVGSHQA